MNANLLLNVKNKLGEGPCWDTDQQCLYWVDILNHSLHVFDYQTKRMSVSQVGDYVSAVSLCESGRLLISPKEGLSFFDLKSGLKEFIQHPEKSHPTHRYNDGKVDPAGRLWIGSMELSAKANQAALYCLYPDQTIDKKLDNVTISNGLAWSSDLQTLYFIDTPTQEIVAFRYHVDTGEIQNRKVAFKISEDEGSPDGMTIDAEGMLWVCHWGGGKVSRWDPVLGKRLDEVTVPVSNVTCCTFGGPELSELFITTARDGLSDEQLEKEPLAGGLFHIQADTKGTPSFKFKDL